MSSGRDPPEEEQSAAAAEPPAAIRFSLSSSSAAPKRRRAWEEEEEVEGGSKKERKRRALVGAVSGASLDALAHPENAPRLEETLVIPMRGGGGAAGDAPLLARSRSLAAGSVEDEGQAFRRDVSLRPDAPTVDTYSGVPIEAFGKAMLRGMGWTEGAPIGGTNRVAAKPTEFAARPRRMGLGAAQAKPGSQRRGAPAPQDAAGQGARVEVVRGAHRGLAGRVDSRGRDGAVLVRLEINGERVTVAREDLRAATPAAAAAAAAVPAPSSKRRRVTWVRAGLRVTVVSRSLAGGRHYSRRGVVEDVTDPYRFTLVMDGGGGGEVVEGVAERNVETSVPREGGRVAVVAGRRLLGATGKVLERSRSRQRATVQMDESGDVERFTFDEVCEVAAR